MDLLPKLQTHIFFFQLFYTGLPKSVVNRATVGMYRCFHSMGIRDAVTYSVSVLHLRY